MPFNVKGKYFSQDTPEEIARKWQRNLSPGRISSAAVRVNKRHLDKIFRTKPHVKVLILGATPELRDLCLARSLEVVSVDMNLDMILGMNLLMKQDNSSEVIVRGNWLNVPLKRGYFDCILGDYAFNMILPAKLDALLSKLRGLLKPGGFLFQQVGIIDYSFTTLKFSEVMAKYDAKKNINPSDLRWDLLVSTWRKTTRKFYYKQYSDYVERYLPLLKKWRRQRKLSKEGWAGLLVYRGSKKEAFLFLKNDFEVPFKRYFTLKETIKGDQPGCYFYLATPKS